MDEKKEIEAVNIATYKLSHSDTGSGFMSILLFDDGSVRAACDAMPVAQLQSAAQLAQLVVAQLTQAGQVVACYEGGDAEVLPSIFTAFARRLLKEVAEASGLALEETL